MAINIALEITITPPTSLVAPQRCASTAVGVRLWVAGQGRARALLMLSDRARCIYGTVSTPRDGQQREFSGRSAIHLLFEAVCVRGKL